MKRRQPKAPTPSETKRCAIYTRKSTSMGLEQEFNSLEAQREACGAYIQRQSGWGLVPERYDDGGFTGANLERPPSSGCWRTWRRARWTWWSSTRWTG